MDELVADLRKIGRNIDEWRAVRAEQHEAALALTAVEAGLVQPPTVAPPRVELSAEDIAAMLPPDLEPLHNSAGALMHDITFLAVRCAKKHIHKYFLRDIVTLGASMKCLTCTGATKSARSIRETAEELLGLPFVLIAGPVPVYVNPALRIELHCVPPRAELPDRRTQDDDGGQLRIYIPAATSVGRVRKTIAAAVFSRPHLAEHPLLHGVGRPIEFVRAKVPIGVAAAMFDG